ncbi:hypothetical protein [Geoalkalibacter subterraneus]|jgi:hypothetical protein|uniref:Uncharacterized protein n=1 Tax=Geoalkalibacter subterraneus TaxID=483547 RepID=A0A0B5FNA8_9BACT|nr:hypothetical protein [Geoalkalibacter subterraneus]AJF05480.1 hypothetical protein GSUB_01270 [Geoalkalibacter subterraneus]
MLFPEKNESQSSAPESSGAFLLCDTSLITLDFQPFKGTGQDATHLGPPHSAGDSRGTADMTLKFDVEYKDQDTS